LTKKASWATWSSQVTWARGASGCGAGGVDHQDVDGAEASGHGSHQLGDLPVVGDVGRERLGDPAGVPDAVHDLDTCLDVETSLAVVSRASWAFHHAGC